MNNAEWFAAYRRWLDDCLAEYNAKHEPRKFHQESLPDSTDYEPGELVEFSEDGDAYPHGNGGTNHLPRAVTPWASSPHYAL